jgi:hypothetical protein
LEAWGEGGEDYPREYLPSLVGPIGDLMIDLPSGLKIVKIIKRFLIPIQLRILV